MNILHNCDLHYKTFLSMYFANKYLRSPCIIILSNIPRWSRSYYMHLSSGLLSIIMYSLCFSMFKKMFMYMFLLTNKCSLNP